MAIDTHGVKGKPWVGFDLDGTLATYDHWRGIQHIGKPVKPMCDLIKKLRDEGKAVKILTARVAPKDGDTKEAAIARAFIAKWCRDNLGFVPPITHEKDSLMETLYDDRVKAVEQNTGKVLNMAKFNVGDKVVYKLSTGDWSGPTKILRVIETAGGPVYEVQGQYGRVQAYELKLANSSACNTLRPYGSWRAASRGNVHVGDYVIHKAQYASFKDDEEKLDRNSERVAGVQADGFWTDMSGTNELERYSDYYVFNAARVRNAVVAKALNARARNDKQFHTYLVPVLRKGVKDYVTIERVADEETAKKLVDVPSFRIIGVTVDETRPVKVAKNATALNFSPGDKVSIVDTDIRYGGDTGEVVRKDGFRYVVRLTSRQDKPEVTLQPNQLKAANSEDAQGRTCWQERGDGKMRADVMKANVEKWKASQKSKNAIVQKALNAATARNAIAGNLPGGTSAARASAELGALADRLAIEADRISDGRHGRRGVSARVDRISGTVTDMKVHVKIGSAFRELESKAKSELDAIGRKYGAKETDVYNWKGDVELSMKF